MEEFLNQHHVSDKILAVGVSGGADSLALVLMANEQLKLFGRKVIALTVDHGLRKNSAKEADYVAKLMKQYGIEHHILTWQGKKPSSGVEEAARIARYDLLCSWCVSHNVNVLMVAHHLRDQAETFLMRMERGSGLEGLCSMREVTYMNGIKILRPLLHTPPEKLEDFLKKRKISWIHDESNDEENFLRVKMRHFLPEFMQKTQITLERFDEAVTNLQSAEDFIRTQTDNIWKRDVKSDFDVVYSIKYTDYLAWHQEIKFRILGKLCKKQYIPRADSVLNLIRAMNHLPFNGVTLGGKEIFIAYKMIWIVPERPSKHQNTRTLWKDFAQRYNNYKERKLPHKAKLAILEKVKNDL